MKVLEAAVENNKISHAYLFSGSRGTGKTSVARIFAKLIGTSPVDLYEIDGASNNGVDEVRELREAVRTLPFQSKYKVYIIDEVHMLSKSAFNALLKTLEEPPPHVIFILATTESYKIPDTIISRCQNFVFKKPSNEEIIEVLSGIVKKEGYKIEKDSLDLIALLSEGSFRDALTILEKILTISKNKIIEVNEVEAVTGAPKSELVEKFLSGILASNTEDSLKILEKARETNLDMRVFTKLVLKLAREHMLASLAPDLVKDRDSKTSITTDQAKKLPNILRAFLNAYNDIGYAYIPTLPLELAVIDLCQ